MSTVLPSPCALGTDAVTSGGELEVERGVLDGSHGLGAALVFGEFDLFGASGVLVVRWSQRVNLCRLGDLFLGSAAPYRRGGGALCDRLDVASR